MNLDFKSYYLYRKIGLHLTAAIIFIGFVSKVFTISIVFPLSTFSLNILFKKCLKHVVFRPFFKLHACGFTINLYKIKIFISFLFLKIYWHL